MQVLGLFFGTLALAAAQFPIRPHNPGFRNVRLPLATSASRQRPYLSIPIVLMPNGQIVPKPVQISYQYSNNGKQQEQQSIHKTSETGENYQMIISPPSFTHQQKHMQVAKQIVESVNAPGRNMGPGPSNEQKGIIQPLQQYQSLKFIHPQNLQTQTVPMSQLPNQRNHPMMQQQQLINNQQVSETHKQNVNNFINFASHLGAEVLSQQRGGHKIIHSNSMPSTENTYGHSDVQKGYLSYVLSGSPTQEQTDGNLYAQTQAQSNAAQYTQQVHHQAVHTGNYNIPQAQHQATSPSTTLRYTQPITRQQGTGQQTHTQNQAGISQQNLGASIQFPGHQNIPVQANSYIQVPQQPARQNYVVVSSQAAVPEARQVSNGNYQSQAQTVKSSLTAQPQIEMSSYGMNAHANQPNQHNQGVQSYITSEGQQINFVNAVQASPVTYAAQQSGIHLSKPNSPQQNLQVNYGQPGDQKLYVSYQSPQDLGVNFATAQTLPKTNAASSSQASQPGGTYQQTSSVLPNMQNMYAGQKEQTVYRIPPQANTGIQSADTGSYTNNQPSYISSGQKQDSVPTAVGGQIIYASSSAKQINYSPSGQGYTTLQQKNNDGQSSPAYASYPEENSAYKHEIDAGSSSTYIKSIQNTQSSNKQLHANTHDSGNENIEDEDEETSYKVVYIPLDILKNIMNNSVENQRSDKES